LIIPRIDRVDRNEALNLFVKSNVKLMLSEIFPKETFRRAKLDYFIGGHRNVGVPRDEEIAEKAIYYFIKNGAVSSDEGLSKVFSLPFFSQNIRNKEPFAEYLRLQKSAITAVEPKKLAEAEARDRFREELKKEIIKEEGKDIEEAIERKKEEYLLVPSVLDNEEFEEPAEQSEPDGEDEYAPWWSRLRLLGDPFPTQEGLARIADDMYEKIIYKTSIFDKYLVLAKESPAELFKDTIFFGEFGSGKTTLFDYLKKPFMNAKIFNIYIQLFAEDSFQVLLADFRRKLFDRLCELHELLYGSDPRGWLKSSDYQENITSLLSKFSADDNVKGVIVIIDDLHKNFDEFDIAMKFVNNLQLFKAELLRRIRGLNLGVLVAGSADWERTIKNDPKYSGSYFRYETMPPVTEAAAHEMLNKRLSAFATNPEMIKTIGKGFVNRIYRSLQNNKLPVTFRSFIKATLIEFDKGNFDILTVDPVHIKKETLAEIKETLEWNKVLKKRIDNLLFGGGIQKEESRKRTLDLLVYTYLQKGLAEDSLTIQQNKFSFQRLARSGLIQKFKQPLGPRWVICKELNDANRKVLKTYNLSLEDYLTKIYIAPLRPRPGKIERTCEELEILDSLLNKIGSKEVRNLMKASRNKHADIIEEMEKHERKPASIDPVVDCTASLALLTKAMARFLGLEIASTNDLLFLRGFWRTFWFSPNEIAEFINQAEKSEVSQIDERVWYSCSVYRDAYDSVVRFFADEVESGFMMIPVAGLSNEEIAQFHEIRRSWSKNLYFEVVDQTTRLVEKKFRRFLFNIFTLLYGEREARLSRLDKMTRDYIQQNIQSDHEKGLGLTKNEFEQVNRGNYKNFIIGMFNKDVGVRNWKQVFEHVFAPVSETEIKVFLDMLAEYNIATSHIKEGAFRAEQQTRIFNFVLKSLEMTRKMNETYRLLIEKSLHIVETQGGFHQLFFSLDNLKDKECLNSISVKNSNAQRVIEQLSRQSRVPIDLEDAEWIESYYSIGYREFMAILARLTIQTPLEAKKTGIRLEIEGFQGSKVFLKVTKM
jgi:hypothetical protein